MQPAAAARQLIAVCVLATTMIEGVRAAKRSPIETVEALHQALRRADRAAADALLHPDYHGVSLQGPRASRRVFVETRERALDTIATLTPGSWDVRILQSTTRIDPNGMAQVWARYVFYLNGAAHHCGYESYVLFDTAAGWQIAAFADTDNPLDGRRLDAACPAGR